MHDSYCFLFSLFHTPLAVLNMFVAFLLIHFKIFSWLHLPGSRENLIPFWDHELELFYCDSLYESPQNLYCSRWEYKLFFIAINGIYCCYNMSMTFLHSEVVARHVTASRIWKFVEMGCCCVPVLQRSPLQEQYSTWTSWVPDRWMHDRVELSFIYPQPRTTLSFPFTIT